MTVGTFVWAVVEDAKRLLLTPWMVAATVLLCACSAFSVALGVHEFRQHKESYDALIQARVEAQLRGGGLVGGRSAEPGLRVIREPAPGTALAAGIEPALPAAWEFTPAGPEALPPYAVHETALNARGLGDLPGIITAIGSLIALWLGVSTVASDKSSGRIAELQTFPVAPQTLVSAHLAGGAAALAIVTAAWCLTVWFTVRLTQPADMGLVPQLTGWLSVPVTSYLALMFALGTGVGAVTRQSAAALLATFLLWLVLVFVLPVTAELIARSVIDVTPRSRMEHDRRSRMDDEIRLLEMEVGAAMTQRDRDLSRSEEQQAAYREVGEAIWTAGLARIRREADQAERQWIEQASRADRVRLWLDGVNPNSWLAASMAELAGTGRSRIAEWSQAIAAHDRGLNQQLFGDRPLVNVRVVRGDEGFRMGLELRPPPRYSDLPAFVPPPPRTGTWTQPALRTFGGLGAYMALAMAAAYFALLSLFR